MGRRNRVDAKLLHREITYKEWIRGENALKFATREQVVAFSQFQLTEQILPLVHSAIMADRWYRRLWRWIGRLVYRRRAASKPASEYLDHLATERATAKAAEEALVGAIGLPEDNGNGRRRTCVVCGSAQLEPVNERGGLKCHNGHVLEEPPPVSEPTASGP